MKSKIYITGAAGFIGFHAAKKFLNKGIKVHGFDSMNNGEFYTTIERTDYGQEIIKYQFKNGNKVKTLFNSSEFDIPRINNYTFSDDENQVLLETETEKIYRHSNKSVYYIYNIFTDKLSKLSDDKIMHTTFSTQGDKVAYVFKNNLYIQNNGS